jgi:alpha-ketoglutarate-dependent taurine dioxygenase
MIAEVTPVHDAPIQGPGAWRGSDFAGPEAWTWQIPARVLAEFDQALRRIRRQGRELPGLGLEDFPAPSFAAAASAIRRELESGRGFVLIRGLPMERYSDEDAAILYWGIGLHVASPIPQNAREEYLFSVRDEGYDFQRDYGKTGVRISRTACAIDFHTDSSAAYAGYTPDIVALLALQTARSGGLSKIVSAQTVHNILRAERPDCLRRLYEPFYFDRRAELRPGEPPTILTPLFAFKDALSIRYFRFNLLRGHETAGVPLTPADLEALDVFESVCRREELAVSFQMERGDMQFVNNRFVLHSRTGFTDHPEPARRRHFLRLWMRYRVQ